MVVKTGITENVDISSCKAIEIARREMDCVEHVLGPSNGKGFGEAKIQSAPSRADTLAKRNLERDSGFLLSSK